MLMIHWWFQFLLSGVYIKSRTFQLLILCHSEVTRGWKGAQLGRPAQTGQKNIPYHMITCSAYTLWGKVGQGSLLRNYLGIPGGGWWAIALCITCFVPPNYSDVAVIVAITIIIPIIIIIITIIIIIIVIIIIIIILFHSVPLYCLYLNPSVSSHILFWAFAPPHWEGGASECLCDV